MIREKEILAFRTCARYFCENYAFHVSNIDKDGTNKNKKRTLDNQKISDVCSLPT